MLKYSSIDWNSKTVKKIVELFKRQELPRLKRLYGYFKGDNKILSRTMESGKPNNKIVSEYCKYITNIGAGYFMGTNVKYKSGNQEYLQYYIDIINDNFEDDENFELAKQAAVHGYAVELIYQNEEGKTRFKRIDPKESILIFSSNIEEFLMAFIHFYVEKTIDDGKIEVAELYTKSEIIHYERKLGGEFKEVHREVHVYGEIPVVLYKNNEEMESDFEGIISLNDGYDKSQSNTANDFDYFTDCYMVISGAADIETDGDSEDNDGQQTAKTIREKKVMFFPDKGDAKFLMKEVNDTATENYKDRLNNDIHKFSMTPDMGDEKFAGNLSGVAIEYKTLPLEDKTVVKENKFRTALMKRREMITTIINMLHRTSYDYREITETFTRTLPQNTKEQTETTLSLGEYVSRRTLLELLSQIEDVDQELERLADEEREQEKKDYPDNNETEDDGIELNDEESES